MNRLTIYASAVVVAVAGLAVGLSVVTADHGHPARPVVSIAPDPHDTVGGAIARASSTNSTDTTPQVSTGDPIVPQPATTTPPTTPTAPSPGPAVLPGPRAPQSCLAAIDAVENGLTHMSADWNAWVAATPTATYDQLVAEAQVFIREANAIAADAAPNAADCRAHG